MSPWVRINDSAMTDLKIVRLPDSALRLWLKGLCYCQMHLTDGYIPKEALGPMEAKRKDVESLCKVLVEGKSPLWEPHGDGFQIHDYLNYNDGRAEVLARQEKDRARKRVSKDSGRNPERNPIRTPTQAPQDFPFRSVGVSSNSLEEKKEIRKPSDGSIDQLLADRSARLLEKYAELYAKHRNGARFRRPLGNLEWIEGIEICRVWDDETLHKLIEILLTTDEEWISKTDRGWKIFNARVQWCAERLAQWEADQRRRA